MQLMIPPEPEATSDLVPPLACSSPGQRESLWISQPKTGASELPVTGAEVVSPFRNAVRLIHHQQARLNSLGLELNAQSFQPLGRDIQQSKRAIGNGKLYRVLLLASQAAVEAGCGKA